MELKILDGVMYVFVFKLLLISEFFDVFLIYKLFMLVSKFKGFLILDFICNIFYYNLYVIFIC